MQRVTGIGGICFEAQDAPALRTAGCEVDERIEGFEFGRLGWVMDPEGNRIELWQPPEGR
jgi:predicted enzyme related to lactoylglutathione lyase